MPQERTVNLAQLAVGAIGERFDRAWAKVLANTIDPNTDPAEARVITLELRVKPKSSDREQAEITGRVKTKLAPEKATFAPLYIGQQDGKPVAVSYDPRQIDAFSTPVEGVTPLHPAREAK